MPGLEISINLETGMIYCWHPISKQTSKMTIDEFRKFVATTKKVYYIDSVVKRLMTFDYNIEQLRKFYQSINGI